ncbi:MAG: hypothetical protein K0S30_22 [Clostridia bacterium]|nr:hypothetical protein [Clostridia bacterium]
MTAQKKNGIFKLTAILLGVLVLLTALYMLLTKTQFIQFTKGYNTLEYEKDILEFELLSNTYIGVNNQQIIKITKDGIAAYDLEGQELWSDTLTLDNYVVKQRESYIAIADKMGQTIWIFNDKGKQGQILCENPIIYFSVNKDGNVAVIESLDESHMIGAYNKNGESFSKRITYAKDAVYPTTVELSPDNEVLVASYVNVDTPTITSTLVAMNTQKPHEQKLDDILYGIEQKDNLIYEIEFIKDNEWVSVGDKMTTWYTLEGSEISRKTELFCLLNPYLVKSSNYGEGFLPVVSAMSINQNTLHRKSSLNFYNAKGEAFFNEELNEEPTYFYADDKGVILGSNNHFKGYNKIGTKLFEYNSNRDVSKLFYLRDKKKALAVTKDKVILLNTKKEEK